MSSSPGPQPEVADRGAGIQQLLRLILVIFFAAVLITEPPAAHLGSCWLLVGGYLVWGLAIYLLGTRVRTVRLLWLSLVVGRRHRGDGLMHSSPYMGKVGINDSILYYRFLSFSSTHQSRPAILRCS